MKETKEIIINIPLDLHSMAEQYANKHEIPLEKVFHMALKEFFDITPLLEKEKERKSIWDIIDVPENYG